MELIIKRDYYAHPPTLWDRLRCFVLCLLTIGHDFEQYFTRISGPYTPGNYTRLSPFGEVALVCRRCELVHDRRDYDGLLPENHSGRGERREVHHLPNAPADDEPLCGAPDVAVGKVTDRMVPTRYRRCRAKPILRE
mgnify:CR=1 FL=1